MRITIQSAIDEWLAVVRDAKSPRTHATYSSSARVFLSSLPKGITPGSVISELTEQNYATMIQCLKRGNAGTEKHHATIIALFFEYLSAMDVLNINMDKIRFMRRNRTRKAPKRLRTIDYPSLTEIAEQVNEINPRRNVYIARAKAFVSLLISSGLRASEAVSLRMSDLDLKGMTGIVIGKGDKQARFTFDEKAVKAIREYHVLRDRESDWIFISHSLRDAKEARHIEYDSARRDVMLICDLLLKEKPTTNITPHQFRHFFITEIVRKTGDIELARMAARHANIATTQGYVEHSESDLMELKKKMSR